MKNRRRYFQGGVPKKKIIKLVVEPFLLDQKKIKSLILKELGERSPFLVPAGSLVKFKKRSSRGRGYLTESCVPGFNMGLNSRSFLGLNYSSKLSARSCF